ncbi:cation:proton antiporter [Psychroserpens sp. Hel_I_66]|uniref:cation:proton antiporter n=1 Tax=Psychroserpens sp. Hel_I_66 TaxID=1250004 RepID=UPI000690D7E5
MAYLPVASKKVKIGYTIPLLILGIILFLFDAPLPWPDPIWPAKETKIFTEIIVIISLMTAGLKIGFIYSRKDWKKPFLLIGVTMPLFMAAIFIISFYVLHISGPLSLLLAAVLAPTDPVLASELQLKDYNQIKGEKGGLRFTLTAEAGINDGLAFPFVFLAILWSQASSFGQIDFWEWFSYYLFYKIAVGILIGVIIGYLFSLSLNYFKKSHKKDILNGFTGVALTLFSYGICELAHGYGFIAVFLCGLFAQFHNRKGNTTEEYPNSTTIHFVEEIERLLMVLWTIFFGGSIMAGILNFTDWKGIVFSLSLVLLWRPLFGFLALYFTNFKMKKKFAVGFFGIRGIGSIFYLSYAIAEGAFKEYEVLYGIIAYTILFSVIFHGLTSHHVISYFNKQED